MNLYVVGASVAGKWLLPGAVESLQPEAVGLLRQLVAISAVGHVQRPVRIAFQRRFVASIIARSDANVPSRMTTSS